MITSDLLNPPINGRDRGHSVMLNMMEASFGNELVYDLMLIQMTSFDSICDNLELKQESLTR